MARARLLWPATTTWAAPFSRASASHSGSLSTTTAPGWTTASFSAAIASRVVAEHFRVLQPDVRQHLNRRAKDVGRIVAPAEPGLDDGDVDAGRRKLGEGRGGEHLELRRLERLGLGTHALDRRLEVRFFPAHADPLAPAAHVWREIRADRQPGAGEQCLCRARHRRLPVRPDDVDRRIAELRIAEPGEQRLDALEPEAVLRPGAQRLDVLNC